MTQKTIRRLHAAGSAALSASLVISGICLMVQCRRIYSLGVHPFSREVVAAYFSPIAIPIYICLALIAATFLLNLFLPEDAKKASAGKQQQLLLKRLREKKDLAACDSSLRAEIEAQRKKRANAHRLCGVVCALCAVVFLSYGMNSGNFHQTEINASMINAMFVLVPCLSVSFAAAVCTVYRDRASIRKEIDLLKQAPSCAAAAEKPDTDKTAALLRRAVLVIGIVLLVFGFLTGGTADVLTKAVNICTECVGLG